jgi:hypothetical protein
LKVRTNFLAVRPRGAIGSALASVVLLASVGGAQSASATTSKSASPSAFCTTIISYHPKSVPSTTNLTSYKAWAKSLEPFYSKLASEAPNAASKAVLNEVVTVLKYYVSSTSLTKLDANVLKYQAKWKAGAKALAAAIISCAKSFE